MPTADKPAPARRTRLTAEQRRESILEAATEVFAAAGYRGAKVSDVAARLGVTEPVIFQNFGSKAALFSAVLDRLASDLHSEMDALVGRHDSVASLLAHILCPPQARKPHGPGPHRALFADAAILIADPGAGEAGIRVARVIAGHLTDLVRRGQADGGIRSDLDPDAAAWLLLSILSTQPMRAAARAGRREHGVADLAIGALLPPDAHPAH